MDAPAFEVSAKALRAESDHALIGRQVGAYKVLSLLGSGGMGEVYRARDTKLGRDVAIKVLPPTFASDPDRLHRFEREARLLAALNHPYIGAIYGLEDADGVHGLVLELVEGPTLADRLNTGPLAITEALAIARQIAEALEAAHAKGIIHRDLKPANIKITREGVVKVLDFGLAKVFGANALATGESQLPTVMATASDAGLVAGTPAYMSPEQARGQSVDVRSDIFSLGCVLYEMVTGRRPFSGQTAAETLAAILRDEPQPLTHSGMRVPLDVERLIRHCLEKKRAERFQSARELAFNLRALGDSGIGQSSWPEQRAQRRPQRRHRKVIHSLAVLPLINASAEPQVEYLSDGITDSIIHTLSYLPKLRVMARSTVFRYKGREVDPQVVGHELGVQAVVTGRLSLLDDRLTIGAELVDVVDGSLLWSEQYKQKLTDILAIQEHISMEISEHLRLKLTRDEKKRVTKRRTENTEAYERFLKGSYYWNKRTADGFYKAVTCFEDAIVKDPNYALAYAGLADVHNNLGSYSIVPAKKAFPQAKAAALKALQLDEALAEAHVSLAFVEFIFEWDWSSAGKEFLRALELNAAYATAHHWHAWYLLAIGQMQEACAEMKRARELDPLSLPINTNLGFVYYFWRQYDKAIEQFRNVLEMDANFAEAHHGLGEAFEQKALFAEAITEFQEARTLSGGSTESLARLGHAYAVAEKGAQAQEILDELTNLSKQRYVSSHDIAAIYAAQGDKEEAFQWLEKAYEEHSYRLVWLKVDPKMDSLRADARFTDLLRRMNLPP